MWDGNSLVLWQYYWQKIEIVHNLMHFKSGPIFSMWDADCLDDVILLLSWELKFSKAGTCGHYMCLVEDKNQSDHLKLNIRSLPMEWQSQTWKQWEEKGGERCVCLLLGSTIIFKQTSQHQTSVWEVVPKHLAACHPPDLHTRSFTKAAPLC